VVNEVYLEPSDDIINYINMFYIFIYQLFYKGIYMVYRGVLNLSTGRYVELLGSLNS
jgi:hypothetical protein